VSRIVCACHYYPESLCPENEVTTQPEALRLADRLTLSDYYEFDAALHCPLAAAELRRQHDEIEQLKAERDALKAAAEREKVAQWMIQRSYATGHGDTTEDLLSELEWQVAERERKAILKQADSLGWVSVDHIRARGEP